MAWRPPCFDDQTKKLEYHWTPYDWKSGLHPSPWAWLSSQVATKPAAKDHE